jgi:hypothetical protein
MNMRCVLLWVVLSIAKERTDGKPSTKSVTESKPALENSALEMLVTEPTPVLDDPIRAHHPARIRSQSENSEVGAPVPKSNERRISRAALMTFYKKYQPANVVRVDTILKSYRNDTAKLSASLLAKYGAAPVAEIQISKASLLAFYRKYQPMKATQKIVEKLIKAYSEKQLNAALLTKYGSKWSQYMASLPRGDCKDKQMNKFETDIDCGGFECEKCSVGQSCREGITDCASGICEEGKCIKANINEVLANVRRWFAPTASPSWAPTAHPTKTTAPTNAPTAPTTAPTTATPTTSPTTFPRPKDFYGIYRSGHSRWEARIKCDNEMHPLGFYYTQRKATSAFNQALRSRKHQGDKTHLQFLARLLPFHTP